MANSKIPNIDITDTLNTQRLRINQLLDSIGDVSTLSTAATSITTSINEHDTELGTVTALAMGTTASTVSTAIAELDGRLDSINTVELLSPRMYLSDASAINTIAGNLNVGDSSNFADNVSIQGNLAVGGNTIMSGTLTVDGAINFKAGSSNSITLGDNANDNVVFNADINSDIIPNTDTAYDLGSSSQEWRNLYIDGVANIDGIRGDSATFTGNLNVDGLTSLDSTAIVGNLTVSKNTALTGNLDVGGLTTLDSTAIAGNLLMNTNKFTVDYLGNTAIAGNLNVGDSSNFADNVSIQGNLAVAGNATAISLNSTDGGLTLSTWDIDASLHGVGNNPVYYSNATHTFIGAISASGNLDVGGITTLDSTSIAGNLRMNTNKFTVDYTGNVLAAGNMQVNGATSLDSLNVDGPLNVDGVTFLDSLNVAGLVDIVGNVGVTGNLSVSDGFTVGGTFTITGNQVSEASYTLVNSNVAVANGNRAGVSVHRPGVDSALMQWNELGDYWEAGIKGNVKQLARQNDSAFFNDLYVSKGKISLSFSDSAAAFSGTGAITIPVGTTVNRPVPVQGQVRYNTTTSSFEGYGASWGSLGGLVDVDQDTKIIAERIAGSDSDTLQFYTAGVLRATLNASRLYTNVALTVQDSAYITGNLVVAGDLTVKGTTTTVNSSQVNIGDNIIVLNSDVTSTPSENAGIEIERGTSTNASLLWDESIDRWVVSGGATGTLAYTSELTVDTNTTYTAGAGLALNTTVFDIDSASLTTHYIQKTQYGTIKASGISQATATSDLTLSATRDIIIAPTGDTVYMRGTSINEQLTFELASASQTITASDHLTLVSGPDDDITLDADGDIVLDANGFFVRIKNGTTGDEVTLALDIFGEFIITAPRDITIAPTGDTVYMRGVTSGEQLSFQLNGSTQTITASDELTLKAGPIGSSFNLKAIGQENTYVATNGIHTFSNDSLGGLGTAGYLKFNLQDSVAGPTLNNIYSGTKLRIYSEQHGSYLQLDSDVTLRSGSSGSLFLDGYDRGIFFKGQSSAGAMISFDLQNATQTITASDALTLVSGAADDITLDADGDIILDADGNDILIKNGAGGDTVTMTLSNDALFTIATPNEFTLNVTNDINFQAGGGQYYFLGTAGQERVLIDNTLHSGTTEAQRLLINNASIYAQSTISTASGNLYLLADSDIYLRPTGDTVYMQGTAATEQLSFQLDAAGQTITSSDILYLKSSTDDIYIQAEGGQVIMSDLSVGTNAFVFNLDTTPELDVAGNFTIDCSGDIYLDADGGDIYLLDANVVRGRFNVETANTVKLYTGTSTLNTTWFSDDMTVAGDITSNSDARLKENVVTVESALEKVTQMRGVYFNKIGEENRSVGVIAQEMEEVLPEVVLTANDEEGIKSVAYGNIVGVLIEAIKELKLEIESLKANK